MSRNLKPVGRHLRLLQDLAKLQLHARELWGGPPGRNVYNPDPESLANKACCSATQLRRVFQNLVGEPLGSFVRRIRLEFGAEQLAATSEGVENIAKACKYGSAQGFSRAFRRLFDEAPSEFRDNNVNASLGFPSRSESFLHSPLQPYRADVGYCVGHAVRTIVYDGPRIKKYILPGDPEED